MFDDDFEKTLERTFKWGFWIALAGSVVTLVAIVVAIIVVMALVF